MSIPACVTHGDVDDLVYNDFYVGRLGRRDHRGRVRRPHGKRRARPAQRHPPVFPGGGRPGEVHRKARGHRKGEGIRSIDPVTECHLQAGAVLEMDTPPKSAGWTAPPARQRPPWGEKAKLVIRERACSPRGQQQAYTDFEVVMDGEGASTDLVSRSVARGDSYQAYRSKITGNAACAGHSECDAIIAENGPGRRGAGAFGEPRGRGADTRGGHRQDSGGADTEAAHPGPDRGGGRRRRSWRGFLS